MKRLIVTGDDFGLAGPVNEAIDEAHRRGILTTASLMVGAPATADAVAQARALPSLRVGLHLVLAAGRPVLPPAAVPALVDAAGKFPRGLVGASFRWVLHPAARRQVAEEIRAQFAAFAETGLPLDHLNTHCHLHLHPLVLALILKIGQEFGLRAMRIPREPPGRFGRAAGRTPGASLVNQFFLRPWIGLLRRRLARRGIRGNDWILGLRDSGAMTGERVLELLPQLPEGVTEMYFHPATRRSAETDRQMPGYRLVEEFQALTSPRVAEALDRLGVKRITFSDI